MMRLTIFLGLAILLAACGGGTTTSVSTPEGTVTVDHSRGEVTARNAQTGEVVTARAALPADYPAEFSYPATDGVLNAVSNNQGTMTVAFTTADRAAPVLDFYRAAAMKGGWAIEAAMEAGAMRILQGKRGQSVLVVQIQENGAGELTMVTVSIGVEE